MSKSNNRLEGTTLYWIEEQDSVGRPTWKTSEENWFGTLLAKGFFIQTPDTQEDFVEPVPAIVEIDSKNPHWKIEAMKHGLTKTGVEVVRVVENFTVEPFDIMVATALLDEYYDY